MIACPSCGYPNGETDYRCERCGRRFEAVTFRTAFTGEFDGDAGPAAPEPARRAHTDAVPADSEPPQPAPGDTGPEAVSSEAEAPWKSELSSRVERFRQRRLAQAYLPFESVATEASEPAGTRREPGPRFGDRKVIPFEEIAGARMAARSAAAASASAESNAAPALDEAREVRPRLPASEPVVAGTDAGGPHAAVETAPPSAPPAPPSPGALRGAETGSIVPPPRVSRRARSRSNPDAATGGRQVGFVFPENRPLAFAGDRTPIGPTVNVDVAPLAARGIAAGIDAGFLAAGYLVFFASYGLTGGGLPVQRAGLAALLVAAAALAFAYFLLFLIFAGATPGMHWIGLRLVDFEGRPTLRGQRTLRLLAMTASVAALGFGFLWAVADEDELTWHDRISQTCLTVDESVFQRRSG